MIAPHTSCRYAVVAAGDGLEVAAVHGLHSEGAYLSVMVEGPGGSHYAAAPLWAVNGRLRGFAPNLGAALTLLRWMEDGA